MGADGDYPPFNSIDDEGKLVGFNIDIGDSLCTAMEAQCEWITASWEQLIPALRQGRIDAIIASMSITPEREALISFTDNYYVSPVRFIRRKGSLYTPLRITDKTVGVETGTGPDKLVSAKFPAAAVKRYVEQQQANLDLVAGRLDLVAADAFILARFLDTDEGRGAEFVGPGYSDSKYLGGGIGIGVRREDEELREKFNRALVRIREDGTYETISARYFDFDIDSE